MDAKVQTADAVDARFSRLHGEELIYLGTCFFLVECILLSICCRVFASSDAAMLTITNLYM